MSAIGNTLAPCLSGLSSETESDRAVESSTGVTKGVECTTESSEDPLKKLQGRFVKEVRRSSQCAQQNGQWSLELDTFREEPMRSHVTLGKGVRGDTVLSE